MPVTFTIEGIQPCTTLLPSYPSIDSAYSDLVAKNNNRDCDDYSPLDPTPPIALEYHSTHHPFPLMKRFVWGDSFQVIQSSPHPLVSAAHMAFDKHYPLVLKPDHIWLCIAQSFSTHIKQNVDKYKDLLFKDGTKKDLDNKTKINIRRDDFIKGQHNQWEEVIDSFSQQIKVQVGDSTHSMIVADFSTTTIDEKIASEIVLMDMLGPFFDINMTTMCGIPSFTLEGTLQDWKSVRGRVEAFSQFGLQWWVDALRPVLDEFVRAFQGPLDATQIKFWESFYKLKDKSGGPYVSGWINTLFPYITSHDGTTVINEPCKHWSKSKMYPTSASFSEGLSRVSFTWHYLLSSFDMDMLGGFVGYSQNPHSFAVSPEIGFVVVEKDAKAP